MIMLFSHSSRAIYIISAGVQPPERRVFPRVLTESLLECLGDVNKRLAGRLVVGRHDNGVSGIAAHANFGEDRDLT